MKVRMLVDTYFNSKRYKKGESVEADETTATRWGKANIAAPEKVKATKDKE